MMSTAIFDSHFRRYFRISRSFSTAKHSVCLAVSIATSNTAKQNESLDDLKRIDFRTVLSILFTDLDLSQVIPTSFFLI